VGVGGSNVAVGGVSVGVLVGALVGAVVLVGVVVGLGVALGATYTFVGVFFTVGVGVLDGFGVALTRGEGGRLKSSFDFPLSVSRSVVFEVGRIFIPNPGPTIANKNIMENRNKETIEISSLYFLRNVFRFVIIHMILSNRCG